MCDLLKEEPTPWFLSVHPLSDKVTRLESRAVGKWASMKGVGEAVNKGGHNAEPEMGLIEKPLQYASWCFFFF